MEVRARTRRVSRGHTEIRPIETSDRHGIGGGGWVVPTMVGRLGCVDHGSKGWDGMRTQGDR